MYKKSFPVGWKGLINRDKDILIYSLEQAVPPGSFFPTEPNKGSLAYNVGLGHKTPIATVLAAVPVIAHHPIIIVLAGVGICLFAVDDKFAVCFV